MSDQLISIGHSQIADEQLLPLGSRLGVRRRQDAAWRALRAVTDAAALTIAALLAGTPELAAGWYAVSAALVLVALALTGAYAPRLRLPTLLEQMRQFATVGAVVLIGVGAVAVSVFDVTGAGDGFALFWLMTTLTMTAGRGVVTSARRSAWRRAGRGRTLIVGAGRVGNLTATRLATEDELGLVPVGFLDKDPLAEQQSTLPVLGASWDLERVVARERIEHVVIAFSTAPHAVLLDIVRRCWKLGVDVMIVPRLYEVEGRRVTVEHLGGLPLVTVQASGSRGPAVELKYAVDRAVATIGLIAAAPLMAVVALAILLTMGRPVLFRQRRVGRDGVVFEMLKFRTMRGVPESDGEADADWAAIVAGGLGMPTGVHAAEERRTPLGAALRRFSLDELPQLWNVLRGDMSLVGPRPERPAYVERFEDIVYRYPDRHRVKSGLTGWAQIHGLRGETSLADRVEWDNFYIENWSLWLDLKIVLRTLPAVLGRGGT